MPAAESGRFSWFPSKRRQQRTLHFGAECRLRRGSQRCSIAREARSWLKADPMYPDFEELLAQFNSAGVEYLIGGAHALALHARPRATKDLDLYIAPTRRNATRVVRALASFFGGTAPSYASVENLLDPNIFVQLGVAPVRVDLLPKLFTTTFAVAWKRRVSAPFGRVPAHFLSRADLI